MKKQDIQKLSNVIKILVKKEVNTAMEEISSVMAQVIKETLDSKLGASKELIQETDLISEKRKELSKVKDNFSNKINYGYNLSQLANKNNNNITYNKKSSVPPINTKNKILNEIFSQVAEDMPSNFSATAYGTGNPLMEMNQLSFTTDNVIPVRTNVNTSFNTNMNFDNSMISNNINPNINIQKKFELPSQDPEGKPINMNNVNPDIFNKLIKDYSGVVKLAEEKSKMRRGQ